jgi:hypothetical protein
MRCNLRWGITIAVLAVVVTLTGGSSMVLKADSGNQDLTTVNGGGSLLGNSHFGGKATFAIHAEIDFSADPMDNATGSGEYHDPSAGVDVHLTVLSGRTGRKENNGIHLFGIYTPQPMAFGSGGEFEVVVSDGELLGPGVPDSFFIVFGGFGGDIGVYDGYSNGGDLLGGNIRIDEP